MSSSLRRGSMTSSMTSLRSQPALPPKPTNIQIKKTSGGSYKVSGSSLKSPSSGSSLKNVGSKATLSKPSSPKVSCISQRNKIIKYNFCTFQCSILLLPIKPMHWRTLWALEKRKIFLERVVIPSSKILKIFIPLGPLDL